MEKQIVAAKLLGLKQTILSMKIRRYKIGLSAAAAILTGVGKK